jgi:hypothetical protein
VRNPETLIRRYLDEHGGRVDAHIRHLADSWDLKEIEDDDLEAIRGALAEVGVQTDPPLPARASSGRLTLYIEANGDQGDSVAVATEPEPPSVDAGRR